MKFTTQYLVCALVGMTSALAAAREPELRIGPYVLGMSNASAAKAGGLEECKQVTAGVIRCMAMQRHWG